MEDLQSMLSVHGRGQTCKIKMGGMTFEIESELLEQAARQAVEQRQLSNTNNFESYETAIAH